MSSCRVVVMPRMIHRLLTKSSQRPVGAADYCEWVCGDSPGMHFDIEVHDIFTRTQLGIQRDRRLIAVVRLHKDH